MTAPTLLEDTNLANFASTPLVYRGGSGCQLARRRANSASDTLTCNKRALASIVMLSPSYTKAMLPPTAASGAT